MKKLISRLTMILLILALTPLNVMAVHMPYFQQSSTYEIQDSRHISYCNVAITSGQSGLISLDCAIGATGIMNKLGISSVVIEKNQSGSWVAAKTWDDVHYEYNSAYASVYIAYRGSVGTEYRAVVTFTASNSSGSDSRIITSSSVFAK